MHHFGVQRATQGAASGSPRSLLCSTPYHVSRGVHQRRTRNIDAPFPGTPLPDEILDLPSSERQDIMDRMGPMYPHLGNITQIESTGRSSARTLRLRVQPRGELAMFGVDLSGNLLYTWGPTRRDHVTSPLFGLPTGYTNGRTVNLSMSVDF